MSENLDPAVSPLRACEPTGTGWTLEQLCKYGWVPKRIKISYKFSVRTLTGELFFDHWNEYEFDGDEVSIVCSGKPWVGYDDGGDGEIWPNFGEAGDEFMAFLGEHDYFDFPIWFGQLTFADEEYEYSLTHDEDSGQFADALEVVTKDNTGNDVSFFYTLMSITNGPAPTGFYFGEGDFIRYEVTEWLSYNGVWDTDTGELLVADPWA